MLREGTIQKRWKYGRNNIGYGRVCLCAAMLNIRLHVERGGYDGQKRAIRRRKILDG